MRNERKPLTQDSLPFPPLPSGSTAGRDDGSNRWRGHRLQPLSYNGDVLADAGLCLDIGIALGSPVSLDYHKKAPFKFNGTIERMHVKYIAAK